MKKALLFVVIFVVGIFIVASLFPKKKITNYPSAGTDIIAYGDSLVQGVGSTFGGDFVSVLSKKIGRPIVNLGRSGDTTADGLARISDLDKYNPKVVLLLLGGNDYLKKIPPNETEVNLIKIIKNIQARGAIVVLLGVRGGLITDRFEKMYKDLSKRNQTAYVQDVLRGLIFNTNYMFDTIHPNNAGYALIAEKIYPTLVRVIK